MPDHVLLTMYYSPNNQADAHKYKTSQTQKDYLFGFQDKWIVCPERAGAHNWEGVGFQTAAYALQGVSSALRASLPKLSFNHNNVVLSGHSRGGHGSLVLATHYPDRFKAVISASGWFRREYYGDSNPIFNHDVQLGFQDLETKNILERSIAEHDCTQSASNLQDLGVYVRHGGSDRTVPVWMGRRYSRVLAQRGIAAVYEELPEMDHWWWDTAVPNDGGVMFDTTLRAFIDAHFETSVAISERFTVSSLNPATFGPKHGIQILKMMSPGSRATAQVTVASSCVYQVDTKNIAAFQLVDSEVAITRHCQQSQGTVLKLDVDGTGLELELAEATETSIIKSSAGWVLNAHLHPHLLHAAKTAGPMRQAFTRAVCAVVDTTDEYLLSLAVYLANSHAIASGTPMDIIDSAVDADQELTCSNFVLFDLNLTHPWLGTAALPVTRRHQQLLYTSEDGDQHSGVAGIFNIPTTTLRAVAADVDSTVSIVATGTSRAHLTAVVQQSFASNQALTRALYTNMLPDYVIVGPDFKAIGFGDAQVGFRGSASIAGEQQ
eukprot:m.137027 g.137027  ORF g.137027 m.137027 type:complete len:549 (+) comp16038_c0_seq1:1155-2801(+)